VQPESKYWFPAKRYGWGWGLPATWQGWLVLAVFAGLLVAGTILFPPGTAPVFYSVYVVVLGVLLFGVCWLKGEPPRWRWGMTTAPNTSSRGLCRPLRRKPAHALVCGSLRRHPSGAAAECRGERCG
jgi:hypothetical protein